MLVDREELLKAMNMVQPGVSKGDIREQSSCFIFQKGWIMTFNDELACRYPTGLPAEFEMAVPAEQLVRLFERLKEEKLDLEIKKGRLRIRGHNRQAKHAIEKEIQLPIGEVELPERDSWKKADHRLFEAIDLARQCTVTGKTNHFWRKCVHIHPKLVEACDNDQYLCYPLATGVAESVMVRGTAASGLLPMAMTRMALTPNFIHFRNDERLLVSCRRHNEEFPKGMRKYLEMTGTKISIPKGLLGAIEVCRAYCQEGDDKKVKGKVRVELVTGQITIKAIGPKAEYAEVKRVDYEGEPLNWIIACDILEEITEKFNDCLVDDKFLRVDTGKYRYIASLTDNSSKEEDE